MIQIFGERNSCNNYLVKLIVSNLNVECDKTHQKPDKWPYSHRIVLTKNPYAWLLSLHRKPHGPNSFRRRYVHLSFDEFLRAQWRGYANAIERYKDIMECYDAFLDDPSVLWVKSEDLQRDPEATIRRIAEKFQIKMDGFENIEREVNSGGNLVDQFTRLDYYLKEEWKEKLTKGQIKTINKVLGDGIFKRFKYRKL